MGLQPACAAVSMQDWQHGSFGPLVVQAEVALGMVNAREPSL
jgi:hypothetical protein